MEVKAYHDSHKRAYRDPFGAVICGQTVHFRLKVASPVPADHCWLRIWETPAEQSRLIPLCRQEAPDASKNEAWAWYTGDYQAPGTPGLVWYDFRIDVMGRTLYYGNNDERCGGVGRLRDVNQLRNVIPPSWQLTVYTPMAIPEWYRRGVIYQIFVDRFYQGQGTSLLQREAPPNSLLHLHWEDTPFYIRDAQGKVTHWDFFGGNLEGILEKLPYLQELGISILYLNPIFKAASNHKYDTGDYHTIDPLYGTEETLTQLITRAQQAGISVILDGVFSHTGSDSLYFNKEGHYPSVGAYQSPASPYFSWYHFQPGNPGYECWWNIEDLPEVDEMNDSYRRFLWGGQGNVIHHWMNLGVAGWRLDVADELPDTFIQELRQVVKAVNPEAVLIGEVWENASNKISYGQLRQYFWGQELDGTMNYPLREIILLFLVGEGEAATVHRQLMHLYETYPRENFYALMNLMGSHDRTRIFTLLGEAPAEASLSDDQRRAFRLSPAARRLAAARLKLFTLILMAFPGVPCIYYGDETGLEGYSDPYNRGTYPWGREDQDLIQIFRRMIRWRREYDVLVTGDFRSFYHGQGVYGFQRTGEEEAILVIVNRHSSSAQKIHMQIDLNLSINLAPNPDPIPDPDGYPDSEPCQHYGHPLEAPPLYSAEQPSKAHPHHTLRVIDLGSGEVLAVGHPFKQTVTLRPLSGRALLVKVVAMDKMRPPMARASGVLMPVSSLPTPRGWGDLGISAYRFVDFLAAAHQSLWQVLPLHPIGPGNSPYQSDSAFAGNPLLISLDTLIEEGLLEEAEVHQALPPHGLANDNRADDCAFERYLTVKEHLLRKAFHAFQMRMKKQNSLANYTRFLQDHQTWLDDYALFRALKAHYQGLSWFEWDAAIARRTPKTLQAYTQQLTVEIEFHRFVQYTFFTQWYALKKYASGLGIQIIGDMPLYVAADSCDVWVHQELFKLAENGRPSQVAGVPPDYFSAAGQRWDNPVYQWEAHAATQYAWWKKRVRHALTLFDYLRIDHFRGLEAYWEIEAGEETAVHGRWLKGPGKRFFESLAEEGGTLPFLAEDLGIITPEVNTLRRLFGFPGMKVLQFTPISEVQDASDTQWVYYSGTHDNPPLRAWLQKQRPHESAAAENDERSICQTLIEAMFFSPAAWVILPLQDILGLDETARMNVPGTVGNNWLWQAAPDTWTKENQNWLCDLTKRAQRE